MLEALITKISSAISPLRLVYHSSRPIDRRLMTFGFVEMPWFFLIKVTGANRASSPPLSSETKFMDVEKFRGQECSQYEKAQAGCPRWLLTYISRLSGRKG